MDPSDWSPAHLDEYPFAFIGLGKDGRPKREHGQNGFCIRGSGPQIDAGRPNELDVPITLNEIRFSEDRLGDSTGTINEEERSTKSVLLDLIFGFLEFRSCAGDLLGPPRCA
jgi:hypothetical protein